MNRTGLMNLTSFQIELEQDFDIVFAGHLKNLHGSHYFYRKMISNLYKRIKDNDFIKLSEKRYNDYLNYPHKQVLGQSENFEIYRIAGHIYLNRKNKNNWETAKIY
jgi:hypothetical protein